MPPELGAGAVVLLPEPDPIPVDPGVVGLVVLPLEVEPEPLVLPEAPLPALPLRASRSHFSLSAPVRARHLLASLPDAPDAAPAEPDVPEVELSLLPEDELPEADGVLVLLPEEPAPALPAPEAPEAPELPEPEDCENATPDSARSAAAVAAVRVFNIMESLLRRVDESCAVLHASPMPCPRKKFFGRHGMRALVLALSGASRALLPGVAMSATAAHPPRERNLPLPDITRKGNRMEKIEKSIEVAAPVRAVYNQWTQFEEFPRFMAGVKEVRQLDDTHLHWHAEIWGKDKEWDAEITEQVPDQVIAWRSTSGAPNAGSVRFEPVSHERTRVRLTMEYQPEGAVEKTGDAVGVFSSRVQNSVEDFKKFIEKRGAETGGWRGEVHGGQKTPTSQRQGPGGSR
jgi:uncharacterized membrane protein